MHRCRCYHLASWPTDSQQNALALARSIGTAPSGLLSRLLKVTSGVCCVRKGASPAAGAFRNCHSLQEIQHVRRHDVAVLGLQGEWPAHVRKLEPGKAAVLQEKDIMLPAQRAWG